MDYTSLIWGSSITLSIIAICITKIILEKVRNKK